MGRHTEGSASAGHLDGGIAPEDSAQDRRGGVTRIASWLLTALGLGRRRALFFCGFFGLTGIALVVISFPIYAASASFARHGRPADATVTGVTYTRNLTGKGSYYATVEYTVGGRAYQGQISVNWCTSFGPCQRKVGELVGIVYDVRNPNHVESAEDARGAWIIPAVLIPCGLLIAIPSLALLTGFARAGVRRSAPDPP